jgi:hypothetical protein
MSAEPDLTATVVDTGRATAGVSPHWPLGRQASCTFTIGKCDSIYPLGLAQLPSMSAPLLQRQSPIYALVSAKDQTDIPSAGEQVSEILGSMGMKLCSRALTLVSGSVRRWLNALFRVVLDAVDCAVDHVGFHQSRVIRLEHGLKAIHGRLPSASEDDAELRWLGTFSDVKEAGSLR